MCQRIISVVLSIALVWLLCAGTIGASPRGEKEAKLAAKVKAGIVKLGTGPAAQVELKLRDKTKLKGYVYEIAEDHFVVIDARTGAATVVPYPQVTQVKGNNLSTDAKLAIGLGIAFLIAFMIANYTDEP
jgi:hypothetical protein